MGRENDQAQHEQYFWFNGILSTLPIWFRHGAIALLILGIFFRFYNLDHMVYWIDETFTSLRVSGYTKAEFVHNIFTGNVIGIEALQRYQHLNSQSSLAGTIKGLATEEPQLAPLYFVLVKLWSEWFGDSVASIRSFSAVISLFLFPCLWWLCRELFQTSTTAWMAIVLAALTPLHILYAQEARPYSLWTVITLLSSTVLLWAMRVQTRRSWITYGLTVVLGLYTHLLFSAVAVAHGVYIAVMEKVGQQRHLSMPVLSYLLATATALVAFIPWLVVFFIYFDRFAHLSDFGSEPGSLFHLINRWFVNINRVFLGDSLNTANVILVVLSIWALYFLCRYTPQRVWLFVLVLIGIPFLALALPDLVFGGGRSLRIRYLIPAYLGIQLAFAHLFAIQALWGKTWIQKLWRVGLITLITGSVIASTIISQAPFWWSKGGARCAYYFPVSRLINQANIPLVISDSRPADILGLSHQLNPNINFQLVSDPIQLHIASGFNSIFLINPSERMRNTLTQQGYKLTLIYNDSNADKKNQKRFWRVDTIK